VPRLRLLVVHDLLRGIEVQDVYGVQVSVTDRELVLCQDIIIKWPQIFHIFLSQPFDFAMKISFGETPAPQTVQPAASPEDVRLGMEGSESAT